MLLKFLLEGLKREGSIEIELVFGYIGTLINYDMLKRTSKCLMFSKFNKKYYDSYLCTKLNEEKYTFQDEDSFWVPVKHQNEKG